MRNQHLQEKGKFVLMSTDDRRMDELSPILTDEQKSEFEAQIRTIFKEVAGTCCAATVLQSLTKQELDDIRKTCGYRNLSNLKKADLAIALGKWLPMMMWLFCQRLDQERLTLLKNVASNEQLDSGPELTPRKIITMRNHGLLFGGRVKEKKFLFMTEDMKKEFKEILTTDLEERVRLNTEWIRLTHGMLHHCGVMEPALIIRRIAALTGQEVDIDAYMAVMDFAFAYDERARMTRYGFVHWDIEDEKFIVEEQERRPDLKFATFTREQLLEAGEPVYLEKTPQVKRLLAFLFHHYELKGALADEHAHDLVFNIQMGVGISKLMSIVQRQMEIPDQEVLADWVAVLTDLSNNTRQWVLKGHLPAASAAASADGSATASADGIGWMSVPAKKQEQHVEPATRIKPGRNDPCPCGSGKKYKKCCLLQKT